MTAPAQTPPAAPGAPGERLLSSAGGRASAGRRRPAGIARAGA